jgi:capsular exopolysaccharide synthesis family protein
MDLKRYLSAVRKYWWVILIPTLLGAAIGVVTVAHSVRQYQGAVTFFVKTSGDTSVSAVAQGDQFAQRRVNSYVALLSSERLAKMVKTTANLDMSTKDLVKDLSATGDVNTVLLTANATSPSEPDARAIAKAIAVDFPKLVDQVENTGKGPASVNLDVVSGPDVQRLPKGTIRIVGIRAGIGFLLGLALALILDLRDTAVRTDEELEALGASPVLGRIPFDRAVRDAPLIMADAPRSVRAEAFRQLRTNLQFMDVHEPVRMVVVTSAVAGEGKSVTATNLALTVAAAKVRVLLIEGDLRQPKVADYLDLERAVGLSDVIAGRAVLDDVLQPWGDGFMTVLPTGHMPPNPSELLASESAARLFDELRRRFEFIIVDTPPLIPVTDGVVAATRADGVILVVRHGKTTRHQVGLALGALENVSARVLGSVFTMVPTGKHSYYAYYQTNAEDEEGGDDTPLPEASGVAALDSRRAQRQRRTVTVGRRDPAPESDELVNPQQKG